MPHDPVAVTTVVSTGMADRLAAHYGVTLRRTLTGFKYIGEQIGQLEREGHPERFLFGFEESYGYLSGTHARDKDGVNAVLLICQMATMYQKAGVTLPEVLNTLYRTYGWYENGQLVRGVPGANGMERMQAQLTALRKAPPKTLAGHAHRGRLGLCGWSGRFATGRYVGVPTCKRSCSAPSFRHGAKTQTLHGSP